MGTFPGRPGEPWVSQTRHRRVAVEGVLVGGGPCTVMFVQQESGEWLLYRFGVESEAVRIVDADARKIARKLGES